MAWDFQTEPEFQQKLDWMDRFVREEIVPLEADLDPDGSELDPADHARLVDDLHAQLTERNGRFASAWQRGSLCAR